jgi:hypothetical protein
VPEEKKTLDQIPWAERVKVIHQSDLSITLERVWEDAQGNKDTTSADVWHKDFEWSVTLDARAMIRDYMSIDDRMTKDIQAFWEEDKERHYSSTFRDRIMRWLRGGGERHQIRKGPKEWSPRNKRRDRVGKLTNEYGYGNTYNEDPAYWWGDEVFEYAHIDIEDEGEGAVILWSRGGSPMGSYTLPEVWTGGFSEAMSMMSEGDPWSVETFQHWNKTFENAFLWSWHKLGVFEDLEQIEDLDDRHVKQVLGAIEQDPSILLPESVEQILQKFDEFPDQIQKAVNWLMRNHRRDLEKALGQKLIWGDLYAE